MEKFKFLSSLSVSLGIQKSFSESKSDYNDVVLFAKHYGTLFKKRKGAFMKKVDKLEALACAVSNLFNR